MRTWIYMFNGRRKLVQGMTRDQADRKFQERFGFWPSEELVDVEISVIRPLP